MCDGLNTFLLFDYSVNGNLRPDGFRLGLNDYSRHTRLALVNNTSISAVLTVCIDNRIGQIASIKERGRIHWKHTHEILRNGKIFWAIYWCLFMLLWTC